MSIANGVDPQRDPDYELPMVPRVALGMQHVLAMFASNVTPSITAAPPALRLKRWIWSSLTKWPRRSPVLPRCSRQSVLVLLVPACLSWWAPALPLFRS